MEEEKKPEKGTKDNPVYILTPQGALKDISSQANILRSLLEKYKIDNEIVQEIIEKRINELMETLEKE